MVWVIVFVKTLLTILSVSALSASQPSSKDVDLNDLKEHVKKMDAVLQEVQTNSKAQEEQSRALLTSLLSQLTLNTQELSASRNMTKNLQFNFKIMEQNYKTAMGELAELKQSHNDTQRDYRTAMEDLSELQQLHNITIEELADLEQTLNKTQLDLETTLEEFAELKQSNNHSFSKLEGEVKSIQLDKLNNSALLHKDIGFKATLGTVKQLSVNDTIIFDSVNYNEGNGYNKYAGYFTAPVSGTYLFWTYIVYRNDLKGTVVFKILKGETVLDLAFGNSNEPFGTASAITISYLQKGEHTLIRTGKKVELERYFSTAGGVLIQHL